jgi:pyruvate,water dikinase
MADMLRSMGHDGVIGPEDEKAAPLTLKLLAHIPDLVRIARRQMKVEHLVNENATRAAAVLRKLQAIDVNSLGDRELFSIIEEWVQQSPKFMQTVLLLAGVVFLETPVRKACLKVGFPFESLVYPQLAAGQKSVSAQQAIDLVALAHTGSGDDRVVEYLRGSVDDFASLRSELRATAFLQQFEEFLKKYGHRGPYEYDWALPRYNEDPTPLLQAIRAHIASTNAWGGDDARIAESKAEDAWKQFEAKLSRWQRWTLLPKVRKSVRNIKQHYVWREQVRSDLVRILSEVRKWHLVLADRFADRGWIADAQDYFLLRLDEVKQAIATTMTPAAVREIVAGRKIERGKQAALAMPLLMHESELRSLLRVSGVSGGASADNMTGTAVSGGCVDGEVVVVRNPGDFGQMKRGAILVAPATDPSWTPLLTLASGVIVEIGGILSHASTIAREYGLPALANVKHATRRLKTGERIRLDANQEMITRLA